MATLSASIQIQDHMTSAMKSMTNALNIVISSFEKMQQASGKSVDTKAISSARSELAQAGASLSIVTDKIEDMKNKSDKATKNILLKFSQFKSKIGQCTSSGNGLIGTLTKIGSTVAATLGAKEIIALSDTLSQTKARLGLMNDGLQTTDELQQMIYNSAQASRGSYQDTANMVAKLGMNAGDAFDNTRQIVDFAEQVNKQFTLSGASAAESSAASLQLTQALASGVLRGDELNSIFEQAPTLIQSVAKYLGVGVGQIRSMASEGQITADIVKNAMFACADDTNAKFNQMPKTFSQLWTDFQNQALFAFQPVLEKLSEMANSGQIQQMIDGLANACGKMADAVMWVIDNWSWLSPILIGVAGAIVILNAAITACSIATTIMAAAEAAVLWPILIIVAAIALLISVIVYCVQNWEYIKVAAIFCWEAIKSAWGAVCDWFSNLWDGIKNGAIALWDGVVSSWNTCVSVVQGIWSGICTFFSGLWNGIVQGAQAVWNGIVSVFMAVYNFYVNIWTSIFNFIAGIWNAIWSAISPVVMAIYNLISAIFGAIFSIISAIMQGIWSVICNVWNTVVGAVVTAVTTVWNIIVSIFTAIYNFNMGIWNSIINFIISIWNTVVEFLTPILTAIWTTITTVCTAIWNTITTIWDTIYFTITGILSAIWNVITNVWNNICSTVSGVMSNIWNAISGAWNNIVSTVQTAVGNVYNSIKSKFDEVVNFIGGLKDTLLQKGKDIMQGLIDGISSKINAIADKIKEVGNTVTNGVKNFFNINSPSRVMRELGGYTFEGFNLGLADQINAVKNTTLRMGAVVTDSTIPDLNSSITNGHISMSANSDGKDYSTLRENVANTNNTTTIIKMPISVEINNENQISSEFDLTDLIKKMSNGITTNLQENLAGVGVYGI